MHNVIFEAEYSVREEYSNLAVLTISALLQSELRAHNESATLKTKCPCTLRSGCQV